MPDYSFVLADDAGSALSELATASGKRLSYKRNTIKEVGCTLSHEDDSAALLFDCLENIGVPTLRAYRDGVLAFNGYLAPFDEDLEETALLNLTFRSPFGRFVGDGDARGRFTEEFRSFVATEAVTIARTLIDEGNAVTTTGLITTGGLAPTTKARSRDYEFANVGSEIIALSALFDGFDFDERFVEQGATLAIFDAYARQGSDRPAAKFEYGEDTLANVRSVHRETLPPINVVRLIGADGLAVDVRDQPSVDKYGEWPAQEAATDVDDTATLTDAAYGLLRPKPVRVVSFTPDPALAPRPWDDFWLGDTVHFYGRRGAFEQEATARVNEITVVVDDEGNEAAEIPDPTDQDEAAVLRARLSLELDIDEGSD